jgi:hypothetical protein
MLCEAVVILIANVPSLLIGLACGDMACPIPQPVLPNFRMSAFMAERSDAMLGVPAVAGCRW